MGHAADTDELLEVLGNELGAIIADDARGGFGMFLLSPLQYDFDFDFGHGRTNLPVYDGTAEAVQNATQVVESAADIYVGNVDMPMFMRLLRLVEARTLLRCFPIPGAQETCTSKYTPDARGADGHDIGIQHHESQTPTSFPGVPVIEIDDGLLLPRQEPKIPGNPAIVLIHFTIALFPSVELALGKTKPGNESGQGQSGTCRPVVDEIYNLVAHIMGNPAALQSSPSSFFNLTCSSINSESTSFFVASFASKASTLRACWPS